MYTLKSPPITLHNLFLLHSNPQFLPKSITVKPNPNYSFTVKSSSSVQELRKPEERELSSKVKDSAPFPPIRAAKRVVLVRHGQSTWNEEGRIQGSSDFSRLTQKGESQAETSRQMLIDDAFDVCFSRFGFCLCLFDLFISC